jgi:hypothetical protein
MRPVRHSKALPRCFTSAIDIDKAPSVSNMYVGRFSKNQIENKTIIRDREEAN